MNKDRLILAVGVGSLLLGAVWVLCFLSVMMPGLKMNEGLFDLGISVFVFILAFALVLPGGFAIYRGVSLLKRSSRSGIKGAVGAVAVMGGVIAKGFLDEALQVDFRDSPSNLTLLPACLIMLWLYIMTSRSLIARAGLGHAHFGDLIGKGTALLFSFLLWFTCSELVEFFAPTLSSEGPGWWGLLHIVAIVAAWWFHIFTASFLEHHKSPDATEVERAQAEGSS